MEVLVLVLVFDADNTYEYHSEYKWVKNCAAQEVFAIQNLNSELRSQKYINFAYLHVFCHLNIFQSQLELKVLEKMMDMVGWLIDCNQHIRNAVFDWH